MTISKSPSLMKRHLETAHCVKRNLLTKISNKAIDSKDLQNTFLQVDKTSVNNGAIRN
jgi:hypothetical protein